MSRPAELDLTAADLPWRRVPMPGAAMGIDVVPLASRAPTFTILARFPAGFSRPTPGGYHCSEEFLVIDGELELEGRSFTRGDLTVIPADFVRRSMSTEPGALALAWFGGPADFLDAAELRPTVEEIRTVRVSPSAAPGSLIASDVGAWTQVSDGSPRAGTGDETVDVVDHDLARWRRGTPPLRPGYVRRDLRP